MSPASAPSERKPMQRIPAAIAALTPTGESSSATHRMRICDHLADDLALDGARPYAVPGPDAIAVVDDLLDAHAPGLPKLRVGQLDANPGKDIVLGLTPHRLRVDQ